MPNQSPLNPDGVLAAKEAMRQVLELDSNEARTLAWEAIAPADYPDAATKPMITAYLAVAQPESEDERIPAWQAVANHPAFNDCYEEERPLLESMLDHLTELTAQPAVNSVEELVMTRAGLALANTAFEEGLSAGIRACNAMDDGAPFKKPVSPYSGPLLAIIKADRPEVDDV